MTEMIRAARLWSVAITAALAPAGSLAQSTASIDAVRSEPLPPPAPVVTVLGADPPTRTSFEATAGPPAYRPQLPPETPVEQVQRDPSAPVSTLVEALSRSYWTNPQLIAERARTRSVDFRLPQARGQYGPQLQYSATYGYQRDVFERAIGEPLERAGWTSTATAVLSMPLFTFGRLRANEDAARGQIAFQRSSLAATEQQILLEAINAYSLVLRDRAGVAIARDHVDLLAREFGDSRIRLGARDTTITDVQQVETRLELARAQLLAAQGAAASSDGFFLRVVGAPAGDLSPPNPLTIPARTLEDAYAYADANNPIIAAAYARERTSRAELELARAELLPRVDLRGQGSVGTVTPYSDNLRQTELRGGLTISGTLDSGIRQARIGEAAAANDADWRLIDDAIRQNRAELADAWYTWQSQSAAVARLATAVGAAEQAFGGALLQQRAGLRTTTEILELTRDLLQVRSSLNSAMASAFVQQARVIAAMGALRHEFLLPETPSYDARLHYERVKRRGDVPLLTPLLRGLDGLTTPPQSDRSVRDPAGPLGTGQGDLDPGAVTTQD